MKIRIGIFYLVAIIFLPLANAEAQSIIPRAGITLATVSGNVNDFNSGFDPKVQFTTGYYAGIGFLFPPLDNGRLMLQAELLWISKGLESELGPKEVFSELHQSNVTVHRIDRYKMNYLEVPILFRTDFGKPGKTFFLLGGFSLSYGMGGKWHYYYSYYHPNESWTQTIDSKIVYKEPSRGSDDVYMDGRFDFGLQVGLGAMVFKGLTVEARYGYSFIEFSRKNQDASAQNRVVQLGVSFPFKLKG